MKKEHSFYTMHHLFFPMLLTCGMFCLLKQSVSLTELQEACMYLKLSLFIMVRSA